MFKNWVGSLVFVSIALGSAAPALAMPTTFDLTGSPTFIGSGAQPFTVISGIHSVDIFGFSHSGGASADAPFSTVTPAGISQDPNGIGVYSGGFDVGQLDAGRFERDEMMLFDFSSFARPVRLDFIVFSLVLTADNFDFAVDDVDVDVNGFFGNDRIDIIGTPGPAGIPILDYIVDFTGGDFIGVEFQLYTANNNDGYRVASIGVSEIPEPATLGLLALAGLAGFRRRKLCE